MTTAIRLRAAFLATIFLGSAAAQAQTVSDGSDRALGAEAAQGAVALLGKSLSSPATARYSRLRPGKAGAVCGDVDTTNRMGDHVGPRGFVVDPAAGFARIVPDGPELRSPASMADYNAMQRALALFRANCEG